MNLGDTLDLAFRNLRQAKLRTALTTVGVSIGIASLTGMVSLGVGLQDQIVGRFMQSGVFDTITVTNANVVGNLGRGGAGQRRGRTPAAPPKPLDDNALKEISSVANVKEAYPQIRVPVQVTLETFSDDMTATGVPMSSQSEGTFQTFSHGTFFKNDSELTCIVSLDLAKRISDDPPALVGKRLSLSYAATSGQSSAEFPADGFQIKRVEKACPIVGIVEREAGGFATGGFGNAGLMIPLNIAKTLNDEIVSNVQSFVQNPQRSKTYGSITVKVTQPQATGDVQAELRKLGYSVFSVSDALQEAKTAFIVLDVILSLIGSIALAVSSLGIVNTMVMSILERTREIGIMKAIGAGNGDIRRIFLIEASIIGLIGGILGIVLGWLVGRIINLGANLYIQSQGGTGGTLFSLPLWLMAGAIGFSILVSLLAGSYPASRAARLDPIRALRHD